jgi:hypothetical protein
MPQVMTGSMEYERDVRRNLFEQSLRINGALMRRPLCAHGLLLSFEDRSTGSGNPEDRIRVHQRVDPAFWAVRAECPDGY